MSAISVLVPESLVAFVEARVASGEYASASDYVSDLVLRDHARADYHEPLSPELKAAILSGLADAEAGRLHAADEVFDRLEAKYAAMAEAVSH